MSFGGGGFFGSGASQSEAYGGPVSSADVLANNNAYASAPVLNLSDSRKSSGKYSTQKANKYNINISQTDYGALAAAADFAETGAELGTTAIVQNSEMAKMLAEQSGEYLKTSLGSSLGFAGDTFESSLANIDETNRRSNQLVTDALDYTAAMIKVGNQSEAANLTEQILNSLPKILIIGGVIFVGGIIAKKVSK